MAKEKKSVAERARELISEAQQRQDPAIKRAAEEFANNADDVYAASIRFVNTEADTGITLARLAVDARDANKKARDRGHARTAYDTALKRLGALDQSDELETVHSKLRQLRKLLKSLGEEV